jgi:predicted ester cyclase
MSGCQFINWYQNSRTEEGKVGNLALADEVLAANFVAHTHPNQAPGPESVKQEVKAFRDGFPDARITIGQMIGEGDTVAFRFAVRGTHLGRFAGFPPTGKEAVLTRVDFVRIADGKMTVASAELSYHSQ